MPTSAHLRPYGMGISLFRRPDISAWQIVSLGPYRFPIFGRLQLSASSAIAPLDFLSSAVRVGEWTWHFHTSPSSFSLLSCGCDRQLLLHSPLSSLYHDSRAFFDGSHSRVLSTFRLLFAQKLATRWPFTDVSGLWSVDGPTTPSYMVRASLPIRQLKSPIAMILR
ncbi:unnamed protein product [Hymenolepis diminuta]|uniref:Uncharacterized protein n=1 Tax=Hymenolepis diminuta TaxID=6216 RepID=A0A564Z0S7_HYMDI|nr:unnamed protein product [Hymenolepis diminuta]